ncbi:MAG: branched-chain amino acid ABC transporter permease [Tepidisphaeraceae bacterium]
MPPRRETFTRWLAPLAAVAVAIALQEFIPRFLGDYANRIAIDAGIAIILAVSLNIVNGYTGQFSIGHAAFYAIGGYTAAGITYYASILLWNHSSTLPGIVNAQTPLFVAATLIGGLVAAAMGWVVGLPSLRLKGDYLAIVTLGFGEILRVLLQQTNTQLYSQAEIHAASLGDLIPPPVGGALGFINVPKITNLFWVWLFVGLTLVIAWRLKRSTFGRSMIAIRENEIAAESMGVNITRLKVWAFVLAAFFAGIAGSLYAHESGVQLSPIDAGFQRSFDIVIIVVLGGLGSISGATVAAVLITVANEWLRDPTQPISLFGLSVPVWAIVLGVMALRLIAWPQKRLSAAIFWLMLAGAVAGSQWLTKTYDINFGDYRMILYALTLILMMILRPGGLFGMVEITDFPALRRQAMKTPEALA